MAKRLIMLAFVVLAVAMAVPASRARIQEDGVQRVKNFIGYRLVPRRLEVMADQLDVRLERAEGLPGNFEGWLRRDFSGAPEDPWGNTYYLIPGRRDYTVGTMGADGVPGTEDDVTVSRPLQQGVARASALPRSPQWRDLQPRDVEVQPVVHAESVRPVDTELTAGSVATSSPFTKRCTWSPRASTARTFLIDASSPLSA